MMPLKHQTIEQITLEIQILRLLCSLMWLLVTISLTLSQINIETKFLIVALGIFTCFDILLRSVKLVETTKNRRAKNKVYINEEF